VHSGQPKLNRTRKRKALSGLKGLLEIVGLEVMTEGVRARTHSEGFRYVTVFRGERGRAFHCFWPAPRAPKTLHVVTPLVIHRVVVHGGWTSWSPWSECSLSCGTSSVRTRRRWCTSPQPRFGGRVCVGEDVQLSECRLPPCHTDGSIVAAFFFMLMIFYL